MMYGNTERGLKEEHKVSEVCIRSALSAAIAAIYFDDSSEFRSALWDVVRELGGAQVARLLEEDASGAYDEYCK